MNIKERNKRVKSLLDINGFNNEIKFPEFNWNVLSKPPILSYIPYQVLQELENIVNSVRLMNNPTKKYKLEEELLKPLGIYHLASGTNRRAFYSEYDPEIVFKIASDKIGRNDNLSELEIQQFIKPFCPKVYDVLPTGLVSLQERVEPMTQSDFKNIYAGDIFDNIFTLLYCGYVMEDVGSNFFKNWGIRYGFGPVVLDFPYVYKLDWSKLRCSFIDPRTGVMCDGYLDYDYHSGMNELCCTKCGTRYSARSLAKIIYTNGLGSLKGIEKRRELTMPLIDVNNVRTSISINGKVVHRYYQETNGIPKQAPYQDNNQKQQKDDNRYGRVYYKKELKNDIIRFLKHVESRYNTETALDLADKLGVRYFTKGNKKQEPVIEEPKKVEYQKPEVNKVQTTYKEINQFDICDNTDYNWKDKSVQNHNIDQEEQPKEPNIKEVEINNADNYNNQLIHKFSDLNSVITESFDQKALEELNNNKPHEGLYPVRAKTREEIEQEHLQNDNENVVRGFPGTPLVDTMIIQQEVPIIKNKVIEKFNNVKINNRETDEVIRELKKDIKDFIKDDIAKFNNGDSNGIEVNIIKTTDERNNECFDVSVTNYTSPLFEARLYIDETENNIIEEEPVIVSKENTNNDGHINIRIKKEIDGGNYMMNKAVEVYLLNKAETLDLDSYYDAEEAKRSITNALCAGLKDNFKDMPYGQANELAKMFVKDRFIFDDKKESTVSDEL